MRKLTHFLYAVVLTLFPVMAMEMDGPEETTGWNDLPPELQQYIVDQLPVEKAIEVALVSRQWHNFVNNDQAWKKRTRSDFQGLQLPPLEDKTWQDMYKSYKELKRKWEIEGDFREINILSYQLNRVKITRSFKVRTRDSHKGPINYILICGYENNNVSIHIQTINIYIQKLLQSLETLAFLMELKK